MSVNTIVELADGKVAIGVSELIQVWDLVDQKLVKIVPQEDTIKTLLPLIPRNKSFEQMLSSNGRKAFVSTNLLVSANSMGKLCIMEVDPLKENGVKCLMET